MMQIAILLSRRPFCTLAVTLMLLGAAIGSFPAWADSNNQRIIELNDHVIAFYDGRDPNALALNGIGWMMAR
jgi:hypothetical protein